MGNTQKTLAMKLLDGKKIAYVVHAYSSDIRDAEQVATAVGFDASAVYKTLVVANPEGKPLLVMLPADKHLDLKKFAKQLNAKKLKMATQREAESQTGLQVGGISALALTNKGFAVYLDSAARDLQQIVISAGQRGLQIQLAVKDLVAVTGARFVDAAD